MKIGVIFTGGTIGSQMGAEGIAPTPKAPQALLSAYAARTGDPSVFPTAEPYSILSEQLTFSHIGVLAECIKEKMQEWDAVIVTHGTDSLQYTGAALGYIFGLSSKPIVLVSANYPLDDPRSNGLDNFCAAVSFLRTVAGVTGVFVSYRNRGEETRIYRATRLLAHLALDDLVYSKDGTVALVNDQGEVALLDDYGEQPDGQAIMSPEALVATEGRILRLFVYPGMRCPDLNGVAAVLLESYHSGTAPTKALPLRMLAKKAKEAGIPVILVGVPAGGTAYETGNAYNALGILCAHPIAPIAAYLKLSLILANGRDPVHALSLPLGGDL